MKTRIQLEPLRGFRDLLPPESEKLSRLMQIFAEIASLHGYREIKPPTLERFEVFAIKSGEEIRKSMFVFKDKAGREVALRPEATASIARIYLKHLRGMTKPIRIFYIVNCFRYEEPQYARYREFWQAGVELLGEPSILGDVEVTKLLLNFYEKIGLISDMKLKLGTTKLYRTLFNSYNIDEEIQDRVLHYMDKKMYEKALELLGKNSQLANILKELWEEPSNIERAKTLLTNVDSNAMVAIEELEFMMNVLKNYKPNLTIELDLSFARGLAYYTGIIFEVIIPGFPVSIAGGGRYDNLVKIYGGEDVPGTGFAIGLDRTLAALEYLGKDGVLEQPAKINVAIILLSREAMHFALKTQDILAARRIPSLIIYPRKLSKILPKLSEQGFTHAIIIGDREVRTGLVTIRDLTTRSQTEVSIDSLPERVKII